MRGTAQNLTLEIIMKQNQKQVKNVLGIIKKQSLGQSGCMPYGHVNCLKMER